MVNVKKQKTEHSSGKDNSGPVDESVLGGFWPGIQLYYPPVKYAPSLGIYEDLEADRKSVV